MAQLIDSMSLPGTKSELDLFQIPPTQIAIEKSQWKEIQLQNACTNEGPYEFHISSDPQMLQLSKNYLFMELRIKKADDTNIVAADNVGPINLIGKTFIKQVKLTLNGKEVFDSGDKYAYRAFLETELSYDEPAKNTQLQAAVYIKDQPGGANSSIDDDANAGLIARRAVFVGSVWVQVMAPIHCDMFAQNRLLVNHIDLRLTLYRNSDAFCMLTGTANAAFKIEVNTMKWYVKGVDILKSIALGLEHTLLTHTAKYPVRRIEIKTLHLSQAVRQTPENALFNGQIPRRVVIGCVDSDAFHGSYAKSPFNFKNFSIREISVTAAGITYPMKPLTMDFANNQFTRAFVQLFEAVGIGGENKGLKIDMKSFKNGCCLFAFDLSPDEDDGSHWDLIKEGTTSVNIEFATAIPASGAEVIMYAEFDNLITIDRNRNPYTDYKA